MGPALDELRELVTASSPPCADLIPFEILDADERGWVRVQFGRQPAFENHFGNIQGGFLVAMLDVPLTLAIYVRTHRLAPTVELKTSFMAPVPIGPCVGEGSVTRAGSRIVFAQAHILAPDGGVGVHATATCLV